jgi:hypothetical protein
MQMVRSNLRPRPLFHRAAAAVLCLLLVSAAPSALRAQTGPATPLEISGFQTYTPHAELLTWLQQVQAGSTEMRLGTYGETFLGRELPFAVFSRPSVRLPQEAMLSGKPVVLLAANVHGGERTLRESLLMIIRDLATPGTESNRLLDQLVIIIAPTINPDGFEAQPRPTRGNSWGIDMNRDYMKLEQQALAAFVENLVYRWQPHIAVDGHNGGAWPYNICYQGPSLADADPTLTALCDREIFPSLNRRMEANGFKAFYYSGVNRNNERIWNGGGPEPRIGRNYQGLSNRVGILFESPGGQDIETGVRSGKVAYEAVLHFAADHPDRVMDTVAQARRWAAVIGDQPRDQVTVQQTYGPVESPVTWEVRVGGRESTETKKVTSDSLMIRPVPTLTRTRPWAYLIPRNAVAAVELLRQHGIAVEVLQADTELEVEAYTVGSIRHIREYDHEAAVEIEVGQVVTRTQRFPVGTYVVPTGQFMGRVAAHLLEPETDDNVYRWNRMDAWLPLTEPRQARAGAGAGFDPEAERPVPQRPGAGQPAERYLPIVKLLKPVPLATKLLPD